MKTKPVIEPSTGRRVLVFAPTMKDVAVNSPKAPFDGGIAYVHSVGAEQSMLNVSYTDHNGVARSQTSVKLLDRAQTPEDAHGKEWYAVWMEYQFNQALRALEPKPNALHRPGDVELVKLTDGEQLTEAGRELVNAELQEQESDGGVLEGANRTTSGAIGQP